MLTTEHITSLGRPKPASAKPPTKPPAKNSPVMHGRPRGGIPRGWNLLVPEKRDPNLIPPPPNLDSPQPFRTPHTHHAPEKPHNQQEWYQRRGRNPIQPDSYRETQRENRRATNRSLMSPGAPPAKRWGYGHLPPSDSPFRVRENQPTPYRSTSQPALRGTKAFKPSTGEQRFRNPPGYPSNTRFYWQPRTNRDPVHRS